MAILNRVKRLFFADVHAILDAVEEPEAVLKQAVREMQEALDVKQAGLVRNQKALAALRNQTTHLKDQLGTIEKDLELSMEQGSEELARKTIGRKLACERLAQSIGRRISALEDLCVQQSQEIDQQQTQLETVLEKAKAYVPITTEESAFSVAQSILDAQEAWPQPNTERKSLLISDEEIELEWIRLQQNSRKGGKS